MVAGEGGQIARIEAFVDDHARVLSQAPVKLAMPDIDRDNFARAMLKQAVGETAGGSAEIEAAPAGDIELKAGQRALEFMAAPADVTVAAAYFNYGRGGTKLACLIPPLTFHPHFPSQNQSLGLFARFGEAPLDQFDVKTAGFHLDRRVRVYEKKSG